MIGPKTVVPFSLSMQTILVTGGAGFIGSCFIRQHLVARDCRIVNLDLLTYAGNTKSIPEKCNDRYVFVHGDIGDSELVAKLLKEYQPESVVNFAAESHVDRSIDGPAPFLQTNVVGTFLLLEANLDYYRSLSPSSQATFRFLHGSTDEVYGSLGATGTFSESTAYAPNSPYAASKASADMFVRAYHQTYKLPVLTTNCSNNYGPYQFPEKLIPLMILNLIERRRLPIYGDGLNVRDWLYVEDHCEAIAAVLRKGVVGETYNIGGSSARTNLSLVELLCDEIDKRFNRTKPASRELIEFVADRSGHDRRYEVDYSKITKELGWKPKICFEEGLHKTIDWYLANLHWVQNVQSGEYKRERIGLRGET